MRLAWLDDSVTEKESTPIVSALLLHTRKRTGSHSLHRRPG